MKSSRLLPLIVACALFVENMDSTVLSTSLPAIAADLGTDPIALKLALTAYLLALAVFIPVSGWVADRFGARRTFVASVAVFLVGSLACAASDTLAQMVAARFLQGAGGALMVPVGRLVLLRTVPKNELVKAISWLTIPALVAPILGPPLGGAISTYADWRWIFLINLPMGLVGLWLGWKFVPDLREPVQPLDWLGFVLTGGGLALSLLGFSTLGRHLLSTEVAAGALVVGLLALVAYVFHARRHPHPLLDLTLFRCRTFRASVIGGSVFRIGVGATPFLLPLMLQLGFGMTPLESGLLTFASAAGAMVMKTMAATVLRRFGFRDVLLWNGVLSSVLLALYGTCEPDTPATAIIAFLLIAGCFRSLQFTALNAMAYADIEPPRMGHASSVAGMMQQFSLALGVAIGGYALQFAAVLGDRPPNDPANFTWAFVVVAAI